MTAKTKTKTKRRKPAKGKTAAKTPIQPVAIDGVVLLMASGLGDETVITACIEKLNIPRDQVDEVLAIARRRITLAADYNRDEVLGQAITRLDDLYVRALGVQDVKTALAAQREKGRLLLGMVVPGPEAPADGETAAETSDRRSVNIESDELAAIVDAIETSIEPLKLTPAEDVNDTDAELITLAAQEIKRLRKALKRATAKPRAKKSNAKKVATKGKTQ